MRFPFALTVSRHYEEDYDSERPFEVDHEEHESDGNVRKRGHNVENQGLRMLNVTMSMFTRSRTHQHKKCVPRRSG